MNNLKQPCETRPATAAERKALRGAYRLLRAASSNGRKPGARPHPVSVARLRAGGLSQQLLLWMQYQAHVQHFRRDTRGRRGLRRLATLKTGPHSVFALTEAGARFALQFLDGSRAAKEFSPPMGRLTSHYDADQRALSWGAHVLKRFVKPSKNQELVVAAGQEQAWPGFYDDPLPICGGKNPKTRLHDAIKCLNRGQNPYLVHFIGDGTGTRVGWEFR